MYYRSSATRKKLIIQSLAIEFILVGIFLAAVGFCFKLKHEMLVQEIPLAGPICGMLNAGVIATGNECAIMWSKILATRENHRTQMQYEAHYNLYVFLFRFLVSYAAFFYIGESIRHKICP